MLQRTLEKMILMINVVLVIWVSQPAAGFTITECEIIGDVNSSLKQVEELIQTARKKLPTDIQSSLPKDCNDLLNNGEKKSGVYLVWPINRIVSGSISVYCDMDTDGGGWTVIQRRGNFSRDKDFFNQDWKDYKEGFGNLEEDFWLGNDYIYALSNQKLYSVRFDLGDVEGNKRYAIYDRFWIEEESNNYKLHVAGYKGDAVDSFSHHSSTMFSTKDRDSDNSNRDCAKLYQAGWWFTDCFHVNLNGKYIPGKLTAETKFKGIHWLLWKGELDSLATVEIKIRTNPSWVK